MRKGSHEMWWFHDFLLLLWMITWCFWWSVLQGSKNSESQSIVLDTCVKRSEMNGGQGLVVSKESCQQGSHCCCWFKLMGNYAFIEREALPSPWLQPCGHAPSHVQVLGITWPVVTTFVPESNPSPFWGISFQKDQQTDLTCSFLLWSLLCMQGVK